jgi:hypothetical protein
MGMVNGNAKTRCEESMSAGETLAIVSDAREPAAQIQPVFTLG